MQVDEKQNVFDILWQALQATSSRSNSVLYAYVAVMYLLIRLEIGGTSVAFGKVLFRNLINCREALAVVPKSKHKVVLHTTLRSTDC